MRFLESLVCCGLFAGAPVAFCSGCIPQSVAPNASSTAVPPVVSRDIRKLARVIRLPRQPLQAVWQAQTLGSPGMGPTDQRVTAILLYRPDDAKYLQASAGLRARSRSTEIAAEPWFPDAIQKMAVRGVGGRSMLKVEELDASAFYKMSLIHGSLYRVGRTPYVIVSLFTT